MLKNAARDATADSPFVGVRKKSKKSDVDILPPSRGASLAILAVLIAADVFLFVSNICPDINYCIKMNRGGGETVVINVSDDTVSFEDAEYRTVKVGDEIIFTHNGTEITPISILSDEEVSKIKASEYIEIRYGYIENFNEKVSEVWTITSLEAVE